MVKKKILLVGAAEGLLLTLLAATPGFTANSGALSLHLTGRYSSGSTTELSGASVTAQNLDTGSVVSVPAYGGPNSSYYQALNVPWGRYRIRIERTGFVTQYWPNQYSQTSAAVVSFADTSNCDPVDSAPCELHTLAAELSQPYTLSGTVKYRTGLPVRGAPVGVSRMTEPDFSQFAVTGSLGDFALTVPPGEYTLSTPNGNTEVTATVEVSSSTVRNLTLMDPPGAPRGVEANPGNHQVTVRWSPPNDDGGDRITSYTVTAAPGHASCVTQQTTCVVDGLDNGREYTFTVVAENSVGASDASEPVGPVSPGVGDPLPPQNVRAVAGDASVEASWSASRSDGVIEYLATAHPGGQSCSTTDLGCTLRRLKNGTQYTVTVKALTLTSVSAESSHSNSATPGTAPSAPRDIRVRPRHSSLRVTWRKPLDDGGRPVTRYVATAWPGGKTCVARIKMKCWIRKLLHKHSYSITVRAQNAFGAGTSSPGSSPLRPLKKRGGALRVKHVQIAVTRNSLTAKWHPISQAKSYAMRLKTQDGWSYWRFVNAPQATIRTSETVSSVQVRALGRNGFGPTTASSP